MATEFEKKVWEICSKIPKGKVSTYSLIAKKLGKPNSARAVGSALSKSPGMPKVPCHRVIKAGGEPGGFAFGQKKKIELLRKEGVKIKGNKIQNFDKIFF